MSWAETIGEVVGGLVGGVAGGISGAAVGAATEGAIGAAVGGTIGLAGAGVGAVPGALAGATGGGGYGALTGGVAGTVAGAGAGYKAGGAAGSWLDSKISQMTGADAKRSEKKSATGDIADVCSTCPCQRTVVISRKASPQAAQHIVDAQAAGYPSVLTYDPTGKTARRAAALSGIPIVPEMDRDEYPPAAFLEGGAGASVRHIPRSDNRSAGGQMAAQLAGASNGCTITMTVGP